METWIEPEEKKLNIIEKKKHIIDIEWESAKDKYKHKPGDVYI